MTSFQYKERGMDILNCLLKTNARISLGWRWLVVKVIPHTKEINYTVYERAPGNKPKIIIETGSEYLACQKLKE